MPEVTVETLQHDLNHAFRELSLLREEVRTQVNSRRGLEGARGPVGPAGADAVVKIQNADGKVQILDPSGKVEAEIIAVSGPKGDSIVGPKGDRGATGATGATGPAPNVDEIVAKVVAVIEARLARK